MKQGIVSKLLLLCFRSQVTKNDEIHVNKEARNAYDETVQILSFTMHSSETAEETGIHNKGMIREVEVNDDEKDKSKETLTPADLMAFAWQISQGMVRRFEEIFHKLINNSSSYNKENHNREEVWINVLGLN